MKQILIGGSVAYPSSAVSTDLTSIPAGAIAAFDLKTGAIKTTAIADDFYLALGKGSGDTPAFVIPEVNFKTLTVTKATYAAGATFTGKMTIPTPQLLYDYTIILAKKGVTFNERNKWTYTVRADMANAISVATKIVRQVNASSEISGVTATNAAGVITFTANAAGDDYELIGADELTGVAPTDVTHGAKAVLDAAYVKDLASQCAENKGYEYTYADGASIYPGYPEPVTGTQYTMWTLRFAVPRAASKTRDEVVYQLVHIVVPSAAGCVETLDTLFGTGS